MTDGVPQWMLNRAKERAEEAGEEYWLPHLKRIMDTNLILYGERCPEEDPYEQAKEQRRQKAVSHHRVIDPERFK